MSVEKLAPCPHLVRYDRFCQATVDEEAEIAAALAYYREHKDRRCETCREWSITRPKHCTVYSVPQRKAFYCADWTAKEQGK